ncbi:hypothetical protein UJ101_02589 [Flavobacteriaceae bacterium UJ101]|nr:hypothetical protein UJ101_02589 [Flavobacteriaceae bacterium UJ101]
MKLDMQGIGFDLSELAKVFVDVSPALNFKFFYEFLKKGKIIRLKKNDILYEEESTEKYFYLILKGYIRAYKDYNEGDFKTTYIFEKHQIIVNIYTTVLNVPSVVGMECITDCVVFKMNYADLENRLLSTPKTSKVLVDYILKYMLRVFEHTDQLTLSTKEERYAWMEENRQDMLRDLPDKHIANYLGVSRASLSRIKKKYYKG